MISKGGSSMMVTAMAFGIMLSVSRFAVRSGKKDEIRREKEALPENLRADNPTQLSSKP
jgi:cell division protein FtsW